MSKRCSLWGTGMYKDVRARLTVSVGYGYVANCLTLTKAS